MPKLTDTQLVILSAAAQRADGSAYPLPRSLKLNRGSAATVLKSLLGRGLLAERPAGPEDEPWREVDSQRLTLAIAPAGLAAIGVETSPMPEAPPPAELPRDGGADAGVADAGVAADKPTRPTMRAGTKLALLVGMLRREDGATVAEIGAATGWQAHSVRGAISGALKKKLGLTVTSQTADGRGRVYRIVADA